MSDIQPPYPPAPYGPPAPAYQTPPPPVQQGSSGLAITGFILAFLLPPIGLVLSLIGLMTTARARRKGKGLAIAGLVISLILTGGLVAAGVAVAKYGGNLSTVVDPGCTAGKAAIFEGAKVTSSTDIAATRKSIEDTIAGLKDAAAKAKHDNVRDAMNALADDYTQLLQGIDTGNISNDLAARIAADGQTIDSLCTFGQN
jgi:hypothetical protein